MCDLVRPELNGKLAILGYFGVAPDVEVSVPRLDQPTVLTFLFSGVEGDGTFESTFMIVDDSDERIVAATGQGLASALPNRITVLAPTLMAVFGRPGRYSIRLLVDQREHYRAEFRVVQAPSDPASVASPS